MFENSLNAFPDHLRESVLCALLHNVADRLNIEPRPIRLHVVDTSSWLAFTRLQGVPTMYISPTVSIGVIAHEIAHCLVPTRWLFFAEGIATHIGCSITGHCREMLFLEKTPEAVVQRYWDFSFEQFSALLSATLDRPSAFDGGKFITFEGRLAHMIAAAFVQYSLRSIEDFVSRLLETDIPTPEEFLEQSFGMSLNQIHALWYAYLRERRGMTSSPHIASSEYPTK